MLRLDGKVALVTGCGCHGAGWGNGKAMTVLLARQGATVFGIDRDPAAAAETAQIAAQTARLFLEAEIGSDLVRIEWRKVVTPEAMRLGGPGGIAAGSRMARAAGSARPAQRRCEGGLPALATLA